MPGRVKKFKVKRLSATIVKKVRARARAMGRGRLSAPNVHRFVRTSTMSLSNNTSVDGTVSKNASYLQVSLVGGGGVIQYGSGSIFASLEAVADYTDFTTLFDAYRIDRCQIVFTPFFSNSSTGAAYSSSSAQATLLWHDIVDTDDASKPPASEAGLDAMRQHQGFRTRTITSGRPIIRSFTPRTAMAVYQGAFTGYAKAPGKTFYDCNSYQTQFYGYKFIVEGNYPGSQMDLLIKCEMKVHLTCKDVR